MSKYYVDWNTETGGDHKVHRRDYCPTAPAATHRVDLGSHESISAAIDAAERIFPNSSPCPLCCAGQLQQ